MRRLTSFALPSLLVLSAWACKPAPPPSAATQPIDNVTLGLRWVELAPGVEVVVNEGSRLALRTSEAEIAVEVAEEDPAGVDLVAVTKAYRDRIEAEGGKVLGAAQLVAPTGPAYTTRADHGGKEERCIFFLHPDGGGRLVTVTSRYAAGDAERAKRQMEPLLELVAAVEAVPSRG